MSLSPSHLLTESIVIACSSPYFMHLGNFRFSAYYFPQRRDHENIILLAPSGIASTQYRLSFSKVSWSVGFSGIITASKFRYGRQFKHSQWLEETKLTTPQTPSITIFSPSDKVQLWVGSMYEKGLRINTYGHRLVESRGSLMESARELTSINQEMWLLVTRWLH